ncbi:hypothetical protein NFX46_03385 [Streptomyces phaeoluteigriseus]|uniref:Uncharacterized protein n=1 Tax=Streptomyces phaeoluteigriseus TaxID=114686 RepID=A0ABY4Z1G4_9ACTN|nr:hypothetical protein [Streptomyces phaeoluteigriseus]USQ82897.1 hypothetical protein NFX46_03385 [Streptomyces phaeoluteigriseus]
MPLLRLSHPVGRREGQRAGDRRRGPGIDGVCLRVLTVTLRQPERDGLVGRTVHPARTRRAASTHPPGRHRAPRHRSLVTWTEHHQGTVAAARAAYDERETSSP